MYTSIIALICMECIFEYQELAIFILITSNVFREMRGVMKPRKNIQIESNGDEMDNDFKILAEAIHPRKLTKELKDSIIKASTTEITQSFFINQNDTKFSNQKHGRQFSLLPILLYLIFTRKKIAVDIKWNKSQSKDPTVTETYKNLQEDLSSYDDLQLQSQDFVNQFLKQKKFKNLLKLIDEKMNTYQRQASRKMQNKTGKIQIQYIKLRAFEKSIAQLHKILNFFGMFYTIFARIIQRYHITIRKMNLSICMGISDNAKNENTLLQQLIEKIGWHFWKVVFQIKSVVSIEVSTQRLRRFFLPISLIVQKTNPPKSEKKETQIPSQDGLFTEILRGYFTDRKIDSKDKVIDPDYLIPFFKITPHLKVLRLVFENNDNNDLLIIKNSYKVFKAISQSSKLIESLCFLNSELSFDEKDIEKSSIPIIDQNQQQIENSQQELQKIDENLFWLEKMQESCPYLSGVKLQFTRMRQDEETRLPLQEKQKYMLKINKSSQILNGFYIRGMNNQTFFNTIKVLKSEGFDYETILGVLDKKNPFTPL